MPYTDEVVAHYVQNLVCDGHSFWNNALNVTDFFLNVIGRQAIPCTND